MERSLLAMLALLLTTAQARAAGPLIPTDVGVRVVKVEPAAKPGFMQVQVEYAVYAGHSQKLGVTQLEVPAGKEVWLANHRFMSNDAGQIEPAGPTYLTVSAAGRVSVRKYYPLGDVPSCQLGVLGIKLSKGAGGEVQGRLWQDHTSRLCVATGQGYGFLSRFIYGKTTQRVSIELDDPARPLQYPGVVEGSDVYFRAQLAKRGTTVVSLGRLDTSPTSTWHGLKLHIGQGRDGTPQLRGVSKVLHYPKTLMNPPGT